MKYCKDCTDAHQLCALCAMTVHEREKNDVVDRQTNWKSKAAVLVCAGLGR